MIFTLGQVFPNDEAQNFLLREEKKIIIIFLLKKKISYIYDS